MESKTTVIIGAIVLFLAGFFIGQLTGGGLKKGQVSVVMQDGKALDLVLNDMNDKLTAVKKNMDDLMTKVNAKPQRAPGPEEGKLYNFELSNHTPRGPENAKVTIVEFSDFQCPYCQRMANFLDEIAKQYPKDVKIYFKHRPLTSIHQFAQNAHEAAAAAKAQGKFWQMYDILFKNRDKLDDASLEKYAAEIGLNVSKFKDAMTNHTYKAEVDADVKEAEKFMINSTPTVFINGYFVSRPAPDQVKAQIEAALKK